MARDLPIARKGKRVLEAWKQRWQATQAQAQSGTVAWDRVLGFDSGLYSCRNGPEILRHILVHCPREVGRMIELRAVYRGRLDFRRLLDTPTGARVANRWIVQSGHLL